MRIYPGYPSSALLLRPNRREFLRRALLGAAALPILGACRVKKPAAPEPDTSGDETCTATTEDIEGPYYREGAPHRTGLAPEGAPGQAFVLTGQVTSLDCTPLVGALVDVWHADDAGDYDNSSTAFWYRGKTFTDADGRYRFDTVFPGAYGTGGGRFRPAHVHFKISHGGLELTTQLYFEGDEFLEDDPWAEASRTIGLTDEDGVLRGVFDVGLG